MSVLPFPIVISMSELSMHFAALQRRVDARLQQQQQSPNTQPAGSKCESKPKDVKSGACYHQPSVYIMNSFFWTQLSSAHGRGGAAHKSKNTITKPQQHQHQYAALERAARAYGYHYQYANVERWTLPKRTGTQDCVLGRECILIPINITMSHW